MNTLHEAAQQALGFVTSEVWGTTTYMDVRVYEDAAKLRDVLRAALKREEEAAAWLAERKEHWRKEREKAQAAKDQDPELSAALGWPGGISNPVLDRTQLLQMVAALRVSAPQALEALEYAQQDRECPSTARQAITALRSALEQEQAEPDLSRCPQCNGPADNGFDRSIPPSPYLCTKCMAEPVQEQAETRGYAQKIEELIAQRDALLEALKEIVDAADGKGWEQLDPSFKKARAAIKAVEGEKK